MVHPGRILLEEFLAPRGISVWHLAKDINVPARRIYEIVQGQRPISIDIAHRLAHCFGMSERYWLDLQARYDGMREDKLQTELLKKQSLRYVPDKQGGMVMIDNTPRPTTRTLAVIDGGLNVKACVHSLHPTGNRSCWNKSSKPFEHATIATEPKKRMSIGLSDLYSFITKDIPRK